MPPGLGNMLEFDLVFQAVDKVSSVLEGIAGALETVISTTADWRTQLNAVQSNTTLTTAQISQMNTAIQAMSRQSGAPMADLAQAFLHVTDVGFSMADATKVVQAAMESAISTGSQTSDVANVLGMQMHEFGIQATQASEAMNVLHDASAMSNVTLDNYVESTSKAIAMSANLGVSFVDANAALSALGRHMDISQANTAFAGELVKMVNDSKGAMDIIKQLSQATGIDLVTDFSSAGLAAKGFAAVQADLAKATDGNSSLMLKLIAATRGGLASLVLAGTGAKDFNDDINRLNQDWSGKLDPTTAAYTRTLNTFNQKLAIVGVDWQQFIMDIGAPVLDTLTPYLTQLINWMNSHQSDIKAFGDAIGKTVGGAITGLITEIPRLFTAVDTEWTKFTKLSDAVGKTFDGIGSGIHGTLTGILDGIYTLADGTVIAFENAINVLIGAINQFLSQYTSTKLPSIDVPSLAAQQQGMADFVQSILGGVGTASAAGIPGGPSSTTHSGGGETRFGASSSFQTYEYGQNGQLVARGGGPTDAWWNAHHPAKKTTDSGSGNGNGGSGGYDPTVALAQANAALQDAQNRLQIDIYKNAPMLTLQGDAKKIMQDYSAAIIGHTPSAIELEGLQLQHQIAAATKSTAAVTTNWRVFAPFQSASEGSTIAAYGFSGGQNAQAQMIAALREQISHLLTQNALITRLLTSSQRQELAAERSAQADVTTAQNTTKMASATGAPTQRQNPLAAHGLTVAHRP